MTTKVETADLNTIETIEILVPRTTLREEVEVVTLSVPTTKSRKFMRLLWLQGGLKKTKEPAILMLVLHLIYPQ